MNQPFAHNAQCPIAKFPLNTTIEIELDKSTPWIQEILEELNENVEEDSPEALLQRSELNVHLSMTKKFKNDLGEYLLVYIEVDAQYLDQCVKTLETLSLPLNLEMKCVFIDFNLEDSDQFKEQTETFIENDVFELYFYSANILDLKDVLREIIFLNKENYPTVEGAQKDYSQ